MVDAESEVPDDDLRQQLAAMQTLLATPRNEEAHDVLIATALQRLASGPATLAQIHSFVAQCWPGAGVAAASTEAALDAGAAVGYLERIGSTWHLTELGGTSVEGPRTWAGEVVSRSRQQLEREVEKTLGFATDGEVERLHDVLLQSLFKAIRDAFASEDRQVELFNGRIVVPRRYDLARIRSRIDALVDEPDRRDFLQGLALVAIDPSSPFCTELVHHISTGYVLQAFLARQDHSGARELVGSLAGGRSIIETPVLLALMDDPDRARRIRQVISQAISTGVEVELLQETVEELDRLLDRLERDEIPQVEQAIADGTSLEVLRSVYSAGTPVGAWLHRHEADRSFGWVDFRLSLGSVLDGLSAMGVRSPSAADDEDPDQVVRFERAISDALELGDRGRGKSQIEHDALILARIDRLRADSGSSSGPFVITTDRFMGPAYGAVGGLDAGQTVVLTLGQWASLLASFADPGSVEELASATAHEVAQETIVSIAIQFPVGESAHLASVLAQAELPLADLALAPLDVRELLDASPGLLNEPSLVARTAASLVGRKAGRDSAASDLHRQFAADDRDRAVADKAVASDRARLVEEQLAAEREARVQEKAQLDSLAAELDDERLARRRTSRVYGLVTLAVAALVFVLTQGWWFTAAGLLVGIWVLLDRGRDWAEDRDKRASSMLAALWPEVLAVADILLRQ